MVFSSQPRFFSFAVYTISYRIASDVLRIAKNFPVLLPFLTIGGKKSAPTNVEAEGVSKIQSLRFVPASEIAAGAQSGTFGAFSEFCYRFSPIKNSDSVPGPE